MFYACEKYGCKIFLNVNMDKGFKNEDLKKHSEF
jgi:hypothetical protein